MTATQPPSPTPNPQQAAINRAAAIQAQRSLEAQRGQARGRAEQPSGMDLVEDFARVKHAFMNGARDASLPPELRAPLLKAIAAMTELDVAASAYKLRVLEAAASETGPGADRVESQPSAVRSGPEGERGRDSQDGKPVTLERVV